ncbi:MAG: ribose-phosphate pyrophosphokinase [Pseudomonadota bacterium]
MSPLLFALPGNEAPAQRLATLRGWPLGQLETRRFPDGESYARFLTDVQGRQVVLVCTLDDPDQKAIALYLVACIARELGAARVGLVAPYLAYMRQDMQFKPGEGISSAHFAGLLSGCVDWLVTVDPHLHRIDSLDRIYRIASRVVPAAPAIAAWIKASVAQPLLIGPDAESEQWVAQVAQAIGCPYTVLSKVRRGDHEVEVSVPAVAQWRHCTPVLVDDIASTARTMMAAVAQLHGLGLLAPVCVAVHPIFAGDAYAQLASAGVARIASCNTIAHASNQIDLAEPLSRAVETLL